MIKQKIKEVSLLALFLAPIGTMVGVIKDSVLIVVISAVVSLISCVVISVLRLP